MAKGDNIGILTGGGDVPGLNSVIKSVVYRATEMGRTVIGIRKGWKGLTDMNHADTGEARLDRQLTRENTRTIDRSGGTALHTSRTNPRKVAAAKVPPHISPDQLKKLTFDGKFYDFTPIVIENLERLGIGCLVAIGGDDTLSFASVLSSHGFPVIGIPKTMDNDVHGTEYCIGFSTAITRAKDAINRQRTTLGSHERIGVFRIFGRDAGFTALYTAYITSARCLIPEVPFDLDRVSTLLMEDKHNNSSNYSLVIVSEGATWTNRAMDEYGEADAYGHRKKVDIGHALADELHRRTGEETIESDLTYDLRSGEPDFVDKLVASAFGAMGLDAVLAGKSGLMTALVNGCYQMVPIPDPKLGPRKVDIATMYNTERYRPTYGDKTGLPIFFIKA